MALPKIEYPILTCVQPSTKRQLKFRQMLVKEEKILLVAKASESPADIFTAIKQVINNCVLDEKFDVDRIPIFDIEYIFLKIRAASIDNVVKVSYKDLDDEKIYDFEIDLDKIEVEFPEKSSNLVKVTDKIGFTMRYPDGRQYDNKEFLEDRDRVFEIMVANCIDKIYDGDETIDAANSSKKELLEFVESLDTKTYDKVREFFANIPSMKHEIKYKNSKGTEKTIRLSTLNDFFTFA
jgi:hypothetical protein